MKIPLEKIIIGKFKVREELDEEHVKEIAESLKKDGQWDPIVVRPSKEKPGFYELISGEYRTEAAKRIGWKEIEATVKDVDDATAWALALKTNLMRRNLKEIEEAKTIQKLIEEYDLTQKEVAEILSRSQAWVSMRLSLVLGIIDEIRDALAANKIRVEHAVALSRLKRKVKAVEKGKEVEKTVPDERRQKQVLKRILEENLTVEQTKELVSLILNDTLYTIGYGGFKDIDYFVKTLKKHKIDVLVDIRDVAFSRKVMFSEEALKRELKRNGIEYLRVPEYGVEDVIREPYLASAMGYGSSDNKIFGYDCFRKWYIFHVAGGPLDQEEFENFVKNLSERNRELAKKVREKREKFIKFIEELKKAGRPCLMCAEQYPIPKGNQTWYCHRHILAELLTAYKDPEKPEMRFEKRVDLPLPEDFLY